MFILFKLLFTHFNIKPFQVRNCRFPIWCEKLNYRNKCNVCCFIRKKRGVFTWLASIWIANPMKCRIGCVYGSWGWIIIKERGANRRFAITRIFDVQYRATEWENSMLLFITFAPTLHCTKPVDFHRNGPVLDASLHISVWSPSCRNVAQVNIIMQYGTIRWYTPLIFKFLLN